MFISCHCSSFLDINFQSTDSISPIVHAHTHFESDFVELESKTAFPSIKLDDFDAGKNFVCHLHAWC